MTAITLTDAEQRLLNRAVMDYALDRGMWADLMRAFKSIVAERLSAAEAERDELKSAGNVAYDSMIERGHQLIALRSELAAAHARAKDYEERYEIAHESFMLSQRDYDTLRAKFDRAANGSQRCSGPRTRSALPFPLREGSHEYICEHPHP